MYLCTTVASGVSQKIFMGATRKGCTLSRHCLDLDEVRYLIVARNQSTKH